MNNLKEPGFIEGGRFRIIEVFILWEGRVNTKNLQNILEISRQTASYILQQYQKHYPENLQYSASLKGYVPTAVFAPCHSQGRIDEYAHILSQSQHPEDVSLVETGFTHLDAPLRKISPALVQPVIRAIRNKLRINVGYTSIAHPEYESRIIEPHSLVFEGMCWRVRAYCEKHQGYRDFVLLRFNGEYTFEGPATHFAAQDELWNTWLDLIIEPDPRFRPELRRMIEIDHQMENGQRIIPVRAALLMYLRQKLRLDHYQITPEMQQIITNPECLKKITPYMS
ncbi:WYL domain-containing protein [Neptunomonas antarctica]|uniref:WYL domain-containing protein n=1 Tax=Neptunomonas antarctica TaxID=619304 RepID=A0A1N7J4M0_9GAMM|nr:WYL domain-containing protein [Neptunomonas antarctica]SIS44197.1 WYL domain-containing protein [Neptunomonas antarctica]